jgi:hypothetical protein
LLSHGLKAEELDKGSHKMNDSSEHALHPLHKLRKLWLFMIVLVAAAGGIALFGIALAT